MPAHLQLAVPLLAALALSAAAPAASAGTMGLHLASVHSPSKNFNNSNPGVYYRSDDGWTGGVYRNSLRRTSAYGGYTWEYGVLGLTAGGATGYGHGVQLLLVPSIKAFTVQGVSARVAYIPRVEKRIGAHVLHLMVEY